MKTLDPSDLNYRPNYDPSLGNDYHSAGGFNYHQGPVASIFSLFLCVGACFGQCSYCLLMSVLWKGVVADCGEEWVWPIGYFLRAYIRFGSGSRLDRSRLVMSTLYNHYQYIENSPFAGLPELTNDNGSRCHHSCETQAWSMSCCLDAIHDAVNFIE